MRIACGNCPLGICRNAGCPDELSPIAYHFSLHPKFWTQYLQACLASQVAKQQGEYLAKLLTSGKAVPKQPLKDVRPFRYTHRGSLAYVGRDKAVMDVPNVGPLFGWQAGIMSTFCPEWWVGTRRLPCASTKHGWSCAGVAWKGFETYSQFSARNLTLVAFDWVRAKMFGRDVSKV